MEFLSLINWTSPFLFTGLLGDIFHLYSNFAASGLGLHCLPMFHKKDALLTWVNYCQCRQAKEPGINT